MATETKIAVIGLGYVGLPVALAFAKSFPGTIGFDVDESRVDCLRKGIDRNDDLPEGELVNSSLHFTADEGELTGANFFIIAVPTPIDRDRRPDLRPLAEASTLVGEVISKGAVVVFESTVYPGITEEYCGPIIAEVSGLCQGVDFKLGYSPERINPGDREHSLEKIIKVVSGEDAQTLDRVAAVYGTIVAAGVHRASSIKVAEAAKVIENTQRDLNIALMNELSLIFDRMGISTNEVLAAAATKWNFLRFSPGLVGGHCIGVDPYYLTTKAQQLGYQPEVILAGRRINDGMGQFVAQKAVKLLTNTGTIIRNARIGVLGLTFKENVSDIRNSQVPSIVKELLAFGATPIVHDPLVDVADAKVEFDIALVDWAELNNLDALIYAVTHRQFTNRTTSDFDSLLKKGGVLIDVKAALNPAELLPETVYWSL